MKQIVNGRLIVPDSKGKFAVVEGLTLVFDSKIAAISRQIGPCTAPPDIEVIDAEGLYVSPGFINVHIHGIGGADVMDATESALPTMQQSLPKTGVTSFLPTTMTMPLNLIREALNRIRTATKPTDEAGPFQAVAKVLGANVEGPYISKAYKGAQSEASIRKPNFDELIADYADVIKIVTVAPEEAVGTNFIERCRKAGIIASIGHSAADYETTLKAIEQGANHITHLFNAQTPLHHRKPGIVGAALDTAATVELIADNVHVHPMLQRLVWRLKAHNQIVLVTDSLKACGLGDGTYDLGGQRVHVKGEVATLDNGTIAASVATMNRVLANFRANVGAEMAEVVELVTKNPAQELGLYDRVGSLEVGKEADITIFDEAFKVHQTYISGQCSTPT